MNNSGGIRQSFATLFLFQEGYSEYDFVFYVLKQVNFLSLNIV